MRSRPGACARSLNLLVSASGAKVEQRLPRALTYYLEVKVVTDLTFIHRDAEKAHSRKPSFWRCRFSETEGHEEGPGLPLRPGPVVSLRARFPSRTSAPLVRSPEWPSPSPPESSPDGSVQSRPVR